MQSAPSERSSREGRLADPAPFHLLPSSRCFGGWEGASPAATTAVILPELESRTPTQHRSRHWSSLLNFFFFIFFFFESENMIFELRYFSCNKNCIISFVLAFVLRPWSGKVHKNTFWKYVPVACQQIPQKCPSSFQKACAPFMTSQRVRSPLAGS